MNCKAFFSSCYSLIFIGIAFLIIIAAIVVVLVIVIAIDTAINIVMDGVVTLLSRLANGTSFLSDSYYLGSYTDNENGSISRRSSSSLLDLIDIIEALLKFKL